MELFAQRAAAVWPEFSLSPENAAAVQEICLRLDVALAIELRLLEQGFASHAILDRLQSRLQLLTGGALDLPESNRLFARPSIGARSFN